MNSPFGVIITLLTLAAVACLGMGIAIARRAARHAEIRVLLLMIGALTLNLGILAVDSWHMGGANQDFHLHFILVMSTNFLRTLFFAFGGNFLAFTYSRIVYSFPPTHHRRSFWTVVVLNYIAASVTLAGQLWSLVRGLHDSNAWTAAGPGPNGFWPGFVLGCWAALWIAVEGQILVAVYERIPGESRPGSSFLRWYFDATSDNSLTSLGVAPVASNNSMMLPWNGRTEAKAFLTLLIGAGAYGYLLLISDHRTQGGVYRPIWTLASDLLPFFVLVPLIYYKMQLVFFDVLIKRGLLTLAILASSTIFLALSLSSSPRQVLWLAAAGFALAWAYAYRRLDRAFDRFIFGRPDYGQLLVQLAEESRRFADSHSLINHTCAKLQGALGAEFVRFSGNPASTSEEEIVDSKHPVLSVPVDTGNRLHGHLLLGNRARGQLFQSEDIHFVSGLAAQIAAALDYFDQQNKHHELKELAIQSELKALRAQINPHFLFNTLNTLADLIQTNPAEAEKITMNLARIFQFTLETTRREEILLGEEADFIRSYLEIEHARFGHKLQYEIDIPAELRAAPVPPMLIQPLVENSVKHGVSLKAGGGRVLVRARLQNDSLHIMVEDDGMGFKNDDATRNKNGIGLSNVRQRVEHFGGPGCWSLQSVPGQGTIVNFELQISGRKAAYAHIDR